MWHVPICGTTNKHVNPMLEDDALRVDYATVGAFRSDSAFRSASCCRGSAASAS